MAEQERRLDTLTEDELIDIIDELAPTWDGQEKLAQKVSEMEDATMVVELLIGGIDILVKLEPKGGSPISSPVPFYVFPDEATLVDPITIDPSKRKDTRVNFRILAQGNIVEQQGIYNSCLYIAAKCVGKALKVDEKLKDEIFNKLFLEFDLHVIPPRRAIRAFGEIGQMAIGSLLDYIDDASKDPISRDYAQQALNEIGRRR